MATVLVTGASSGFGRLTAASLIHAGHQVAAGMRDITGRNATAAAAMDGRAVELDVQSPDSVDAAIATVLSRHGRLDVVVHNAGHMVLGPAEAPSYRTIFEQVWPAGVAHALLRLRRDALAGDPATRRGQYHLTLCQLWQDITTRLGPPELVKAPAPTLLDPASVAELGRAGLEAERAAP